MISSSIAGMCIQFRILTFYSRSEEQQKECLHLKKYVTSLPVAIAIMDESDRQINFNSLKKSVTSLSAAIMDESDCQINFNSLKKFVTSLTVAIGALSSALGPHSGSDLETDLYSGSTPIAIKTSPIVGSVLVNFKKSTTSIQIYTLAQPSSPI
jgi:hypothetical protein